MYEYTSTRRLVDPPEDTSPFFSDGCNTRFNLLILLASVKDTHTYPGTVDDHLPFGSTLFILFLSVSRAELIPACL